MTHSCRSTVILVLALVVAPWTTFSARGQDAWESTPYKVRIWLAFDDSPRWNETVRSDLHDFLASQGEIFGKATWSVESVDIPEPLRMTALRKTRVSVPTLLKVDEKAVKKLTKIYSISVKDRMGQVEFDACEFDCSTRTWGRRLAGSTRQPRMLGHVAFGLIEKLFSPIMRITVSEGRVASGVLRSAELILYKDSPSNVHVGDVFRPVVRRNDRQGEPMKNRGITPLPWTLLYVRKVAGADISGRLYAMTRNPISGRRSSRTIAYGLLTKPLEETTNVKLMSLEKRPEDKSKILQGYHVYAKDPTMSDEAPADDKDKSTTEHLGQTDWRGVQIVKRGKHKMRILYVRNGQQVLARLPVVPGYDPESIAELPNDDLRLQGESFVTGIQQSLMDVVIQRKVILKRKELLEEDGKIKQVKELVERAKTLRTRDDFAEELIRKQNELNRIAGKRIDTRTRRKVDSLFARTNAILENFVSRDFMSQIRNGVPEEEFRIEGE